MNLLEKHTWHVQQGQQATELRNPRMRIDESELKDRASSSRTGPSIVDFMKMGDKLDEFMTRHNTCQF